jgi:hypothetical protein
MAIWLRITHLFGLPDDQEPNNLIQTALGPALRAACANIVEAPLPSEISRALHRLKRRDRRVGTASAWPRPIPASIMPASPGHHLPQSVDPSITDRRLHSPDTHQHT